MESSDLSSRPWRPKSGKILTRIPGPVLCLRARAWGWRNCRAELRFLRMSLGLLWGAERGSRAWHLPKVPRLPPNSRSGAGKTVREPGKPETTPKPGIPALQRGCSTRSEQWGRLVLVPTRGATLKPGLPSVWLGQAPHPRCAAPPDPGVRGLRPQTPQAHRGRRPVSRAPRFSDFGCKPTCCMQKSGGVRCSRPLLPPPPSASARHEI